VTIVLAHAGLEGQLAHAGTLTHNDLAPLRERVDYLALGHIHKPYAVDDWIFNPGSPETWNVQETAWRKRGSYLVEIEPGGRPQFEVIVPRRRPFYRLPPVAVDALETPQAVYDAVRAAARRQTPTIDRDLQPVIEVTLEGVLAFHRFDLDLEHVQQIVEEELSALLVRVRNQTTPAEFEIAVDAEASRPELEHDIVRELLERDARYRPAAEDWTGVALDLKRLALEDSAPAHVIDHLRRARAELLSGGEEG
jgi:DNA repair exonuclease SbcCD nuclease subunit